MRLGVAFYVLQKYEMVGNLLRRNPGFKNGLFVATRNLNSTDLRSVSRLGVARECGLPRGRAGCSDAYNEFRPT